ncbi:hypothetical protein C8Q75DRAFT_456411 [Abortiporus biennis]|nr:hypothetical protein C8Q75DRAFT_456411 [Abortiporus biennis]
MADSNVTQQFLAYDFDRDEVYQQGLAGIIAGGALSEKSDAEKADVLRRAPLFYFNRKFSQSLNLEDVKLYEEKISQQDTGSPEEPATKEPRTLTFAELKELIEQGKTDQIPNNRVIPNDLNPANPSQSTASLRRKPWETDRVAEETA